ncbi:hypothetical protein K402DRAFT_133446 [Aulographum hederae CBS 113979]|uniref:Uncharacterized protein n=1 Tax=Aulographum hederae CBS 113979 TaxID=1176131 RepID=A0A6G1GUQ1_9PEZI|nr:hypothetical protein K402DRAFT_133446 [Aulographum hederae CBS 113979]
MHTLSNSQCCSTLCISSTPCLYNLVFVSCQTSTLISMLSMRYHFMAKSCLGAFARASCFDLQICSVGVFLILKISSTPSTTPQAESHRATRRALCACDSALDVERLACTCLALH